MENCHHRQNYPPLLSRIVPCSLSGVMVDEIPDEWDQYFHGTECLSTHGLLVLPTPCHLRDQPSGIGPRSSKPDICSVFKKASLNGWVGAAAGISESADFGTAGPTTVCTNSWLDINTLTCTLHKLRIKITVIWIKLGNRENSSFHKIYCFGHICAWSGSNLHCFTQRRCSPILIARDHLAILSDAGLDGWVTLEWTWPYIQKANKFKDSVFSGQKNLRKKSVNSHDKTLRQKCVNQSNSMIFDK